MPIPSAVLDSARLSYGALRQSLFSGSFVGKLTARNAYSSRQQLCFSLSKPFRRQQKLISTTTVARAVSKKGKKTTTSTSTDPGSKREAALQNVLDSIESNFGKGSIMRLGGATDSLRVETYPSGSMALDIALGGGFPKGRIVEIYGPESSGKTTLALHAMAEVQKAGGVAALIDAEHAFDPHYAATLGMDVDKLIVCQPESGEMALEVVDQLVRSSAVDVICVDSVAALVPRAEIEGEMGLVQVGSQARLMSQALRKLTTNAAKCNCGVIFINQLRHKIGVIYGSPEVTSGGNALKFYASVRIDIRRIQTLKATDGNETGIRVRTKVVKNKVARPYRTAEMDLIFGAGISALGSILECAESMAIIEKKGSWYSYGETRLGQGREKAVAFLEANPEISKEIEDKLKRSIDPNAELGEEDAILAEDGDMELDEDDDAWPEPLPASKGADAL